MNPSVKHPIVPHVIAGDHRPGVSGEWAEVFDPATGAVSARVPLATAAEVEEALAIHREDVESCRTMGAFGADHVPDGATILTHCNAGALATGGYGTALGVIRAARDAGKRVRVLADETRPYLQGARLTAWELHASGIDVTVICDNMAAYWFGRGAVDRRSQPATPAHMKSTKMTNVFRVIKPRVGHSLR